MKFLIGSLVGAIIGYITNWLAIKMLFKPHKEIRIGKFKVPFTPGLIPKEKSRIAKSVGESIGQHLLTKETILQSLCSENMNEQLDFWVQSKISDIENSQDTVENEIKALLGDEYCDFIQNTNSNISKLFIDYINEEGVKQAIGTYANGQIMLELATTPGVICQSELYNSIKNKVLDVAIEYKDTEKFYGEIENILEEKVNGLKVLDKNFEDVIPKGITDNIKVYVYGKRYDISMAIKRMMKEEKTKKKLRQIVGETITTKLNPMVAMFVNADSTYEKVVTGINEFLDEDENHNDIALMINDIIDKFLKSSVSSLFSEFSKEGIHDGIKPLIKLLTTEVVDEKLIRNTLDKLEDKFNSYVSIEAMLEKSGINYKNEIEKIIKGRIEAMAESNSVKIKIAEIVSVIINRLLNVEMKSIFEGEGDKLSKSISKVVKELYNKFIENKAADVIEVLDIAKIVEDKINEFDVAFSEKIILDIASKELNAITRLGAVLGAIMGLLSPILGSL
ncbi:MAG: DUF445 family protein [Clostridium sp.]|uniref:DUF445 family protein n=1 Tax=Clostridium sp. TaxID=1506 RepID=UPI003D6C746D